MKERGLVIEETTRCPFVVLKNDWEESEWCWILEGISARKEGGGLDQEMYCSG